MAKLYEERRKWVDGLHSSSTITDNTPSTSPRASSENASQLDLRIRSGLSVELLGQQRNTHSYISVTPVLDTPLDTPLGDTMPPTPSHPMPHTPQDDGKDDGSSPSHTDDLRRQLKKRIQILKEEELRTKLRNRQR
ncbi:hypothetical protein FRB99_008075 [Tulasnella sp. 403]|nr:hypothetical protein FRB99_008075 [Tulasnella sp. 403]